MGAHTETIIKEFKSIDAVKEWSAHNGYVLGEPHQFAPTYAITHNDGSFLSEEELNNLQPMESEALYDLREREALSRINNVSPLIVGLYDSVIMHEMMKAGKTFHAENVKVDHEFLARAVPSSDLEDMRRGVRYIPHDVTLARRKGKKVQLVVACTANCSYWQMPDGTKIYHQNREAYLFIGMKNKREIFYDKFDKSMILFEGGPGPCSICGNPYTNGEIVVPERPEFKLLIREGKEDMAKPSGDKKTQPVVDYVKTPEEIRITGMEVCQPVENEWIFRPGIDYYEFQQDADGTFWKRDSHGWVGRSWWPEVNITDGRRRWREVITEGLGYTPICGEVAYEKPMLLQLIELFAGKAICITHIDSNQSPSKGICKTAHAVSPGQREYFDIELKNGIRFGFVPDTVDATSAEGGMGSHIRGRRRFELIV
ncbi:MAG: hypothetical protein WC823_00565 [Parcubacteria group bacterium]